jgi:hypothetical protein
MSKDNRPVVYRSATERITTILWGVAIVAFGIGVIAWLWGYEFDLELAGIVAFAILGLWILGSAITAMIKNGDD